MKTNQIFQYNGSPITFYKDDNVMVNATEMAKPFGKLVGDWLRLKATTEFTEALSADMHIPISALIQVVKGGNSEQGTWPRRCSIGICPLVISIICYMV